MTLTMKILRILSDGQRRTVDELCGATGATRDQIRAAIQNAKRYNDCVDSDRVTVITYGLTPEGVERARWTPKTNPRKLAAKAANNAKRRATERAAANEIGANAEAARNLSSAFWGMKEAA